MSCDYLDCDALIKALINSESRLQGRLDQQDLLVSAQKNRILELLKEKQQVLECNDRQFADMCALRAEITDKNKRILDAQQERMALLEANKAHQEDNKRLQVTVVDLKKTVVELQGTVEALRLALKIVGNLQFS